jgi:hypothetical protein
LAILDEAIAAHPQVVGFHVLLSQVLLKEGADLEAAEQALLNVLRLSPAHADARHNLQVLRRRQQLRK